MSDLHALEARRIRSLIERDEAALRDVFAEDLLWIHSSGRIDDKAALLRKVGGGAIKFLEIEPSDEQVRKLGDAAVVTSTARIVFEAGGTARTRTNVVTVIWRNDDGAWRIVLWQSTTVPDA